MMDSCTDLSDEAMAIRWGGILNEVPELWDALRKWEIENRPAVAAGGFRMRADWVSVDRGTGDVTRIHVRDPRSMK